MEKAAALRARNPADEANAAVRNRDYRLIAFSSFGLSLPGTTRTRDSRYYSAKYGVKEVVGVGDTGNEYTLLYQNEAHHFALTYNLVVLRAVGEKTES